MTDVIRPQQYVMVEVEVITLAEQRLRVMRQMGLHGWIYVTEVLSKRDEGFRSITEVYFRREVRKKG